MPVFYVVTGVLGGAVAAVMSLVLGYSPVFAAMMYPAFGALALVLAAGAVSRRAVPATVD